MNGIDLFRFFHKNPCETPSEKPQQTAKHTAAIRQDGLTCIYPAASASWYDFQAYLDKHHEDESLPWKPPFLECIFDDNADLAHAMKKDGEARDAIPLSPILAEAFRLSSGALPSIPDDLYRLKSLAVEQLGRYQYGYKSFLLWEGAYFLTNLACLPRLSSRFYYSPGDWSAIGKMKKLKSLKLNELVINDFSFLNSLTGLKKLDLYRTNFSQDELLKNLQNLERLNLSGTGFSDCEVLSQLPKLKSVNLCDCKLKNPEALQAISAQIQTNHI